MGLCSGEVCPALHPVCWWFSFWDTKCEGPAPIEILPFGQRKLVHVCATLIMLRCPHPNDPIRQEHVCVCTAFIVGSREWDGWGDDRWKGEVGSGGKECVGRGELVGDVGGQGTCAGWCGVKKGGLSWGGWEGGVRRGGGLGSGLV